MAEFKEVIKQWKRMCESFSHNSYAEFKPCADKCSVGANHVCGEICEATVKEIEEFEAAVIKWAAERQEPVYPTWGDWLLSVGGARKVPDGIPFELPNGEIVEPSYGIVVATWDHIPADIAQKLGIEPKEGT